MLEEQERELSLQEAVRRLDKGSNPVVYGRLIQRCIKARSLDDGRRVHRILAKQGCHRDVYIANLLIQMYAACGSIADAAAAFKKLKHKNMYSWNSMLAAYARCGRVDQARALFSAMAKRDEISWNAVVSMCSAFSLEEAREHFHRMPLWSVVSWNAMISALAKHGRMDEARRMFGAMDSGFRTTASWNAMIQGYARHGQVGEARALFEDMGGARDRVSFGTMIQAYASEGRIRDARRVFDAMSGPDVICCTALVSGYGSAGDVHNAEAVFKRIAEPDTIAWNALLQVYAQNGDVARARAVFDEMPERNLASWNAMIAGYALNGHPGEAKDLFDRAKERNVITHTAMVQAYALAADLESAKLHFDLMPDRNVVSWTTMVTAYSQNGRGKDAVQLFLAMDAEGVRPTPITYVSVFAACGSRLELLRRGELLHRDLVDRRVHIEVCVLNALVHMYARCGKLELARRVFDSMPKQDVVAWNTMLAAYAKTSGQSQRAIELFGLMALDGGCEPDAVTFVVVLFACSHGGMLGLARGHFKSVVFDYGQRTGVEHYVCMVDLLARAGQLARAKELLDTMPFQPDAVAYTALAGSYKGQGQAANVGDGAKSIMEVSPERASPYVMLSQAARLLTQSDLANEQAMQEPVLC